VRIKANLVVLPQPLEKLRGRRSGLLPDPRIIPVEDCARADDWSTAQSDEASEDTEDKWEDSHINVVL